MRSPQRGLRRGRNRRHTGTRRDCDPLQTGLEQHACDANEITAAAAEDRSALRGSGEATVAAIAVAVTQCDRLCLLATLKPSMARTGTLTVVTADVLLLLWV